MIFQVAASADAGDKTSTQENTDEPPGTKSQVVGLKCALVPGRIVRGKEELPNPRRFAKLRLGDAIDSRDRDAAAVVQVLIDKGITHVGDLLDINVKKLFAGLDITQEQLTAFVISIEDSGVRFTSKN